MDVTVTTHDATSTTTSADEFTYSTADLPSVASLSTTAVLSAEATRMLLAWREEARRLADSLGAPAVWALAESDAVQELATQLDRSGELMAELRRVCAEAAAEVAGVHLVRGSQPPDSWQQSTGFRT